MRPDEQREETTSDAYLAAVLGEPVLVSDPLVTAGQAAAVLGVSPQRIYLLARAGILPVAAGNRKRRYRLNDVRALGASLTIHEAAGVLDSEPAEVRRLVEQGILTFTGNRLRPVRRFELEWRQYLKRPLQVRQRRTQPDYSGLVTPQTAAAVLGISVTAVKNYAAEGKLPAIKTGKGWRFRPDLLEMTARAWRAAEENDRR